MTGTDSLIAALKAREPISALLTSMDAVARERYTEGYNEGWEHAQDAIWGEAVCSECGANHDADESAMCEGGQVQTFRDWVERCRG